MRRRLVVILGAAAVCGPVLAGCSTGSRAAYYRQRDNPAVARAGDGTALAYEPEETLDALARRHLAEPTAVTAVGE